MSYPIQAVIWALAYSFFTSLMIGAIHYISAEVHPTVILFFRNAIALVIFLPWFLHAGSGSLKTNRMKMHIGRSLTGFIAMLLWFYSVTILPLAEAVSLNFTAPLFGVAIAIIFLKEKTDTIRLLALFVGFTGMLIILRPGSGIVHYGSLIVLAASFFMAVSAIQVKSLSASDSSKSIVFYLTLISTPLSLLVALPYFTMPNSEQILWLLVVAIFATLMQLCLAKALSLADVSALVPLDFTRLVFAAIIGLVFFQEALDIYTIIGSIVIISSSSFLALKEKAA